MSFNQAGFFLKKYSSLFSFRYHQRSETDKEIKQENITNSKNMKEKLPNGCISIAITVIPFAMLWGSYQYVQK